MAGYPGVLSRVTRQGLTKDSGWSALASNAFFTPDPPDEAHNTLNNLTSAASGAHTVGTGSATGEALTSAASGAIGAKGTSAVTLAAVTSTASGATVTGTSSATLATIVSAGTGTSAGGSSAVTLSALTSSASGARGAAGTSAATLATSTSAGAGLIPAAGSAATTLAALTSVGTDAPAVQIITFDDGTIPDEFFWSAMGSGSVIDRPDAEGGTTKALRYPDIDDSEETYFEIYANARPGNNILTVRYEVSSESGYDYWRIYIDDVEVWEEAGTGAGWSEYSTALDVGLHLIKFRYSKDSSADDGDDTAYISKITVSPIGERPITAANSLAALTSSASGETEIFPGYRFWRITMIATSSISGTAGGIAECELRGTLGGADLTDTLPGVATQYLGTPNVSYPASAAFDNNPATQWISWSSYGSLQWEFTTLPQEVAQIHLTLPSYSTVDGPIYSSDLLDLTVERSYGGETWETVTTKRGIVEPMNWDTPGEIDINLTGPSVSYDGKVGVNAFGVTISTVEFCPDNKVAITGYSIPYPVVIERLIAYSASILPSPPIGATTYTFKIRGVVYGSNVSNVPTDLIAVTAERTSAPNTWFELFLDEPLVLAPGFYHFGVHVGGNSNGIWSRHTFGPEVSLKSLTEWPFEDGPPDPFPMFVFGAVEQEQPHPIYAIHPVITGANTLASATSTAVGLVNAQSTTGTAVAELAELLSDAIGGSTVGTAAISLGAMLSDATGARGWRRSRVSLHGTVRRR